MIRQYLKFFTDFLLNIKSSYWFIPAVLTALSIVLSFCMVQIDLVLGEKWMRGFDFLYSTKPAGARALLSTISGSMITVAGVVFSMTLLSVSHASAQIGPRILSGFMNTTGSQYTLGTFMATFVYCILTLRVVHGEIASTENYETVSSFVPHFSIHVAVLMAILSVSFLIYYIHYVRQTISTTAAVCRVGDQFLKYIDSHFPKKVGDQPGLKTASAADLPADFESRKKPIFSNSKGFFRYVNHEGLVNFASKEKIIVELLKKPGDFISLRLPIGYSYNVKLDNLESVHLKITNTLVIGEERNPSQDMLFPVDLLIEMAVRALSPGVNDPYTAIECINQLEVGLVELALVKKPEPYRVDEQRNLRLICISDGFESILKHVCVRLIPYVITESITKTYFAEFLDRIASSGISEQQTELVKSQIDWIKNLS